MLNFLQKEQCGLKLGGNERRSDEKKWQNRMRDRKRIGFRNIDVS